MSTQTRHWYPAIDGFRTLAVLLVLIEHWAFYLVRNFPSVRPGRVGVHLFFVISGFLITQIILRSLDRAAPGPASKQFFLKSFYARRFLRIFPLYYVVLLIAYCSGIQEVRDRIWWLVSYTSNICDTFFGPGEHFQHFWSLSVEEQFYLVWPFILVSVPKRHQLTAIILMLALFPMGVVVFGWLELPIAITLLPIGCLHTLGGGALLAWLVHNSRDGVAFRIISNVMIAVGLTIAYGIYIVVGTEAGIAGYLCNHTLMALCLTSWVAWAAASTSTPSPFRRLLESPPMLYCGKISYCLYLIHPFVPPIVRRQFAYFDLNTAQVLGKAQLPFFFAVTVLIATASWYLLEAPLNRLKDRFPYVRRV